MTTDEGRAGLGMRLHSVAIHLLRTVRVADAETGLTPARLSALSVLVFGGARTIGELAAAEQVTAPTMTRLVSGLERDGLVERGADARDGRVVRVTATRRARAVLKTARSGRLALLESRLAGLDETEWAALEPAVAGLERVFGP